ncbi:MAG: ThiF family adenylyltransferase [Cyanobacteria bacterium NC_groundwater_1444_Ag_S-0.65um_54_12]|nr:ThiF family adenylyltransferase [Cyanobacteria bacterium NC_groundwater_1444_Ag_S-0.65um_54_12]
MTSEGLGFQLPAHDRFDRQRAIAWWNQDKLAGTVAMVAGCGALGNEVAKNLALLGVGTLILVDFDRIEISNLARSVLFGPSDLGRPKAEVLAERLAEIFPAGRMIPVVGDLWCDLGLGLLRRSDLVFGCLDSVNARFILNRMALRAGTPWLNGGLGMAACQVSFHHPVGGACYECQATPGMIKRFSERYSCAGLLRMPGNQPVPLTVVPAALCASLMVQEALLFWHERAGGLLPGQRLTAQLAPYRFVVDDLPHDPECCAHGVIDAVELAGDPSQVTAADLLGGKAGTLELGFDLVLSLNCRHCGPATILRPRSKVPLEELWCPDCGSMRSAKWVSDISDKMELATYPLQDLGVPEHHIVRVITVETIRNIELAGSLW